MKGFLNPIPWIKGLVRATIRPKPKQPLWQWIEKHVVVPESAGSPYPGPLRMSRSPIFRGLYDLVEQPGTRHMSLCSSARVGKTLFCLAVILYLIAEKTGNIAWLDPSAASARKFVKAELDPFLRLCRAVRRLAILGAKTWSTFWRTFRGGKNMRVLGSGSEGDMHGFSAPYVIGNERDRLRGGTSEDADSFEKMVARAKLFPFTSLVLENSTPGVGGEFSPIWRSFLAGSQHHAYLPCPHCSGKADYAGRVRPIDDSQPEVVGWSPLSRETGLAGFQRLTFKPEKKLVPFDENIRTILGENGRVAPLAQWREEKTGGISYERFAIYEEQPHRHDPTKRESVKIGYDMEALKSGTSYRCAYCEKEIERGDFEWMLNRYRWTAHNPDAPKDRISIHVWAAYSLLEHWWTLAKEWVEAEGNLSRIIKIHQLSWGVPYIRNSARVSNEDIDRVIARSPRYDKGTMPLKPLVLAMTVDKQEDRFYYVIRAYGLVEDHPEKPTWSAAVDWGEAHSWNEILELGGWKPYSDGTRRTFVFTDKKGVRHEFGVFGGLVDSGNGKDTEDVYKFCAENPQFEPYKGAGEITTRSETIRMSSALDDALALWICWSDFFTEELYGDCIKNGLIFGQPANWWLPSVVDKDYRKQLTDEYKDPETKKWKSRTGFNHVGDCEKMQRPFSMRLEEKWLSRAREALRKK